MFNRLAVRQKLGLLLLLPLAAAVFAIIPLTVDRVDAARREAAAASIATTARQTGWLVRDLQRERLAGIAYLTMTTVDRIELLRRFQDVDVRADRLGDTVRAGLDPTGLAALRVRVLERSIDASAAYVGYHDVIQSLVDRLGLDQPYGVDAAGLLDLARLDAGLRANEVASEAGAALVVAAAGDRAGADLLAAALIDGRVEEAHLARAQAPDARAAWNAVVSGRVGQRVQALISLTTGPSPTHSTAGAISALAAAQAYDGLRQNAQDDVAATIVARSDGRASRSRLTAMTVAATAVAILLLIAVLSIRVSRSIASPLRRLTRAAGAVADLAGAELVRVADEDDIGDPPRLAAVDLRGEDEIGELAAAFNRVQATAALLLERQASMRRNVALMFTTIGRRTHSLVARQLAVIDDMERDEQDAVLLERLYRLDHLTARLRRSAESLLVVAGTQDDSQSAPTPLVDVVRGAMAEVAGFQAIRLDVVPAVVVSAELAVDLRLLLAELLENATSFSPPGATVEVGAVRRDNLSLRIVDHGIGMTDTRLAEENHHMVERQRLDVVPTQVLGLFVVGRLARRHGLGVKLDATPVQGVTVTITVPATLFTVTTASLASVRAAAPAAPPVDPALVAVQAPGDDNFDWLNRPGPRRDQVPVTSHAGPAHAFETRPVVDPDPGAVSRNGFNRRRPGQHFPSPVAGTSAVVASGPVAPGPVPSHRAASSRAPGAVPGVARDPGAEAAELEAFARGSAAAEAEIRGDLPRSAVVRPALDGRARGGFTRRVPGHHLAESARTRASTGTHTPADRDPETERQALNDYLLGLAHAERMTDPDHRDQGRR